MTIHAPAAMSTLVNCLISSSRNRPLLQEGEVVRGTVVGISERGVVIDFGYKSEGIVNPAEFTENGVLTVKAGDEVEVLVKSMETADGLPVLSRADAVRMKAWDDLEKAYRDGTSVKGRVIGSHQRWLAR